MENEVGAIDGCWFSETQLKDIADGLSDEEADKEDSNGEEDDEEPVLHKFHRVTWKMMHCDEVDCVWISSEIVMKHGSVNDHSTGKSDDSLNR
ncbi:uncharacterized protein LOC107759217 [Nicotiana tabacum]|uniref:Uncharacterized protein LOC107759217 n=1 Tax=Nicotiana tabacum TaxID=4097 RepID=A0AC58SZT6_TOBAC